MYEVFDHTADLGIRVRSATLPALFEEAGSALSHVIAGDLEQILPRLRQEFSISGVDPAYMLFDFLTEVLYAFESHRMLFRRFEAHVDAQGLRAMAWGEAMDPKRHHLAHEVKAITYHGLDVRERDGAWEGTVIVDI